MPNTINCGIFLQVDSQYKLLLRQFGNAGTCYLAWKLIKKYAAFLQF